MDLMRMLMNKKNYFTVPKDGIMITYGQLFYTNTWNIFFSTTINMIYQCFGIRCNSCWLWYHLSKTQRHVRFCHSLSKLSSNKFLWKSPSNIISLPSFDPFSMKSSNRSLYSIIESGGRYIFPIKNDLPLSWEISNQMQETLFISKSSLRLALISFLTYTMFPPPPLE